MRLKYLFQTYYRVMSTIKNKIKHIMAKPQTDKEIIDRSWHPNFVEYTERIVNNPAYKGLFYERGKDGRVKWVVAGKSVNGQKRQAWWDEKCKELGIPIQKGCYAIAARAIHPTKKHVCQCCGKSLSIEYEYPNKNTLTKINELLELDIEQTEYTIGEIIDTFCDNVEWLKIMCSILHIPEFTDKSSAIQYVYSNLVAKQSGMLSPGAMSNPPDRFDGYHSDGLCCREHTDKGRHTDNMKTYTQDRRAFEEWSDGDYNLANRLMGEFHKDTNLYRCPICGEMRRVSADHIGPISLGFCHSKFFAPLCSPCNSSKNNRFYKSDVDQLIRLENEGNTVISWHSKYVWDTLKKEVHNDADAKRLSTIMSRSHQSVLTLFSMIYEATGEEFLMRYLHPEYSMFDIRFDNFDPTDLSKLVVIRKELDSKNKRKNQKRYIRIAFESLKEFKNKDNRRTVIDLEPYRMDIEDLILMIKNGNEDSADKYLRLIIDKIGEDIINTVWD